MGVFSGCHPGPKRSAQLDTDRSFIPCSFVPNQGWLTKQNMTLAIQCIVPQWRRRGVYRPFNWVGVPEHALLIVHSTRFNLVEFQRLAQLDYILRDLIQEQVDRKQDGRTKVNRYSINTAFRIKCSDKHWSVAWNQTDHWSVHFCI